MTTQRFTGAGGPTSERNFRLYTSEPETNVRPKMRHWFIFTAAVLIAFFGMIYSRISLDHSAFVLEELQEKIEGEEARHWDLRLEVARLQSPERITELATDMGLVYPEQRADLTVPGVDIEGLDPEYRWAQLRSLLSAQP